MPLSKYYGGHGSEVMKNMKKQYGPSKGKEVFYATANKNKSTSHRNKIVKGPSDNIRKKHTGEKK